MTTFAWSELIGAPASAEELLSVFELLSDDDDDDDDDDDAPEDSTSWFCCCSDEFVVDVVVLAELVFDVPDSLVGFDVDDVSGC